MLDKFLAQRKHEHETMLGYCGVIDPRRKSHWNAFFSGIIDIDFVHPDAVLSDNFKPG